MRIASTQTRSLKTPTGLKLDTYRESTTLCLPLRPTASRSSVQMRVVDPKNWARIRASLPRRRSFRHARRTR